MLKEGVFRKVICSKIVAQTQRRFGIGIDKIGESESTRFIFLQTGVRIDEEDGVFFVLKPRGDIERRCCGSNFRGCTDNENDTALFFGLNPFELQNEAAVDFDMALGLKLAGKKGFRIFCMCEHRKGRGRK